MVANYTNQRFGAVDIVRESGHDGLRPIDVLDRLREKYDQVPDVRTVARWLREDFRIERADAFGHYRARLGYRRSPESATAEAASIN